MLSTLHTESSIASPRAFLFDLDGVILDSETVYTEIWEEINRLYPTGVENFALKIKGSTLEKILFDYFPGDELRKNVEAKLYELEGKMKYRYKPGSKETLEFLKGHGVPTALVTSSNEVKMEHVYQQLPELKGFFNTIITGDMVTKSKPDPEGYALAAKRLGFSPEDCVVVEDSFQGVMAGRNLNSKVVGVTGTIPVELLKENADMVVDSLEELIPLCDNG